MKRYKRLLIMASVLIVICVATFALTRYKEQQEEIRIGDTVILELPADSVTSVSWEYSDGDSLAFRKTDDGWKHQDDESFPVSEEKILAILSEFESFGATFIIENVEDYSQYGLDTPEATLHLTTEERSYDIKLGDFSRMDEQRYVDIGDGNVYLVSSDPMDYVSASLSHMILHDNIPGFQKVVNIMFSGSENYTVVRTDESTDTYNPEKDIYFVERNGKTVPLDTDKIKTYLKTVTSLELADYVTYNATEEELQICGLDEPILSVTVNFTYADNDENEISESCTLHISENPEERAACDAAVAEGNASTSVTKYVRIGNSQIVYTLDDADFSTLTEASYDDLRHREVFWADFDTVTRIDIVLEGNEHTLVSQTDEYDERTWYYGGDAFTSALTEETDPVDISDIKSALLKLTADSFTDELPGEVEEISLTLHLDNENFPTAEIRLYRFDGLLCLAVTDGSPVSLVSRSSVMALVEAVQAIVLNG